MGIRKESVSSARRMKTAKFEPCIYDVLEAIRKRSGFYISSPSLTSLKDFLAGLSVGRQFPPHATETDPSFGDFSSWFCLHLKAPASAAGGWYGAIKDECGDEAKAFQRFFEYLDSFRRRRPVLRYEVTLTPGQRRALVKREGPGSPKRLRLTRYKGDKCLFLHVQWPKGNWSRGWCMYAGFASLAKARPWLLERFGVTSAQWKRSRVKL
jgi:hypothetical protein